jgi:hypothetical protein
MINRTHIDHAELLQFGKMVLLLIKRQQIMLEPFMSVQTKPTADGSRIPR